MHFCVVDAVLVMSVLFSCSPVNLSNDNQEMPYIIRTVSSEYFDCSELLLCSLSSSSALSLLYTMSPPCYCWCFFLLIM